MRAGVHTGEAEVVGDDLRGISVHIGSRVALKARESELLVSSTVRDLCTRSGPDRVRLTLEWIALDDLERHPPSA